MYLRGFIRVFTCFFAYSILLGSMISCSEQTEDPSNKKVLLPLYKNDHYGFEVVELKTIRSLSEASGEAAVFTVFPKITDTELIGGRPELKLQKNEDYWVPRDVFTTQVLSIYYHMEKLKEMDALLGVAHLNPGPRKVGFNVLIRDDNGDMSENNALYSGDLDAMLFVPYTLSDFPVTINGGVMAHEHFHSLFYKTLISKVVVSNKSFFDCTTTSSLTTANFADLKPQAGFTPHTDLFVSSQTCRNDYNMVLMRGLNEGLADFWGWLYSDDENFVGRSLPKAVENRNISYGVAKTTSTKEIKKELNTNMSEDEKIGLSYELGTSYARVLKAYYQSYMKAMHSVDPDLKTKMARTILMSINSLSTQVSGFSESEILFSDEFFRHFINSWNSLYGAMPEKSCIRIESIVKEKDRPSLCN